MADRHNVITNVMTTSVLEAEEHWNVSCSVERRKNGLFFWFYVYHICCVFIFHILHVLCLSFLLSLGLPDLTEIRDPAIQRRHGGADEENQAGGTAGYVDVTCDTWM